MPCIWIEYDETVVLPSDAEKLCHASRDAVVAVYGKDDVYAWGNSSAVKTAVDPVEIFVELSSHLVEDLDKWSDAVSERLRAWKEATGFSHPINLTVTPQHWKVTIGI